jgi:hypothetical protein
MNNVKERHFYEFRCDYCNAELCTFNSENSVSFELIAYCPNDGHKLHFMNADSSTPTYPQRV